MERNGYPLLVISLVLIALALGTVAGIMIDRQVLRYGYGPMLGIPVTSGSPKTDSVDMDLIKEAWDTIDRIYVDRDAVIPLQLTYGAISGMVDALGDTGHSRFLTPDMVEQENNFTDGQVEGIGVEVQIEDGQLVIVSPIAGSPAEKAGLEPGDIIQKVDGQEITGKSLTEMVAAIKGPAGTSVDLTILRPQTGDMHEVRVERARFPIPAVIWQMAPGSQVAHVRISAFTRGVSQELVAALEEAKQHGAEGVVLDLRNNPGGLLQESIQVASQFLPDGYVMQEKDAQGNVRPVPVVDGGVATDIPLVVLVNQGSASASEIVAGALQDTKRGTIVGETTYGTGTVLNQFNLSDGSALLLATEEWLTPNGRVIWHKGIEPDEFVALPATVSPLNPLSEEGMTVDALLQSGDAQFIRALEVLGVVFDPALESTTP